MSLGAWAELSQQSPEIRAGRTSMRPRRQDWSLSRLLRRWTAGAAVLGLSTSLGCGTLITQVDGPLFAPGERTFNWDGQEASPVYSGTRLSWGGATKSEAFYVWVVDLPLSFVADTAILPLSLLQDGLSRVLPEKEEEEVVRPEATPMPR